MTKKKRDTFGRLQLPPGLERRWAPDGGPELCVKNIVAHLDFLLDEDDKREINWHPEQSASLAVMRVIDKWLTAKEDRDDARVQLEIVDI